MTKCKCAACQTHWSDEDKRPQYSEMDMAAIKALDDAEMDMGRNAHWLDCNQAIRKAAFGMGEFLVKKNVSYNNAIFEPIRCFGDGSALDNVNSRIDEKIKRITSKKDFPGDDDAKDLCGYLILRMAILAMERDK